MSTEQKKYRVVAFLGSMRPGNNTAKALALVVDELREGEGVAVEVVDPAELNMGFPGAGQSKELMQELQAKVREATGVIFATPEYHGSYSSVTKLLIEHLGFPSALSGKPVALLGVAAGAIGAIKSLEHLHSVCSHVGALPLPGSVSVAGVSRLFDAEGRCLDEKIEQRIRGLGKGLIHFIEQNICPRMALERMVREES